MNVYVVKLKIDGDFITVVCFDTSVTFCSSVGMRTFSINQGTRDSNELSTWSWNAGWIVPL